MPNSHDTYIKKTMLAGKTLRRTVYFLQDYYKIHFFGLCLLLTCNLR